MRHHPTPPALKTPPPAATSSLRADWRGPSPEWLTSASITGDGPMPVGRPARCSSSIIFRAVVVEMDHPARANVEAGAGTAIGSDTELLGKRIIALALPLETLPIGNLGSFGDFAVQAFGFGLDR